MHIKDKMSKDKVKKQLMYAEGDHTVYNFWTTQLKMIERLNQLKLQQRQQHRRVK